MDFALPLPPSLLGDRERDRDRVGRLLNVSYSSSLTSSSLIRRSLPFALPCSALSKRLSSFRSRFSSLRFLRSSFRCRFSSLPASINESSIGFGCSPFSTVEGPASVPGAGRTAGLKPLDGQNQWRSVRRCKFEITDSATANASSSASLTFLISSSLSASVFFRSRLYQCTSLFFCHLPVGALIE